MKSKKEIYSKYGIQYKAGKILSPIGFVGELLKEGNTKTGKTFTPIRCCPVPENTALNFTEMCTL